MAKFFSINSVVQYYYVLYKPWFIVQTGLNMARRGVFDDVDIECIWYLDNIALLRATEKQSKASHYNDTTAGGKRRLQLT
jgi:hypothetical protein